MRLEACIGEEGAVFAREMPRACRQPHNRDSPAPLLRRYMLGAAYVAAVVALQSE
jgi:hypothetical protein